MKPARKFSWRGLTPQLFVIVVLPLTALVLVVTLGGLAIHQHSMRTLVGERDARAVSAAASAVSELITSRGNTLWGLAQLVEAGAKDGSLAEDLRELDYLLPDFDLGLAVTSGNDNTLRHFIGDQAFWQGLDIEALSAGQVFPPKGGSSVYILQDHPVTGKPVELVVSPLTEGGWRMMGAFSPSDLAERALEKILTPGNDSLAFIVTPDKRILYQAGEMIHADISTHPGVVEALQGKRGAGYVDSSQGVEHVMAYSPIEPVGWALVFEEPWNTIASPVLRLTEDAPLVIVPALLLAMAALWFGTRWIVQPLQALETQAAELTWGKFDAIENPVGGIAEIRNLQGELVHMAQKLKAAQEGLRGYINAITLGQEEERRRLSRELHDDTLQSLIALSQRVQLAGMNPGDQALSNSLAEIHNLTTQAIQNLRRITRALRPTYLEDLGLGTALEMLADETSRENTLKVDFQQVGEVVRLPQTTELALYRISQECLSNVQHHARATHASIRMLYANEGVTLEVSDNGVGFEVPESPAAFAPGGHFGLLGMHERAELIGASLAIHSEPGGGTRVTVRLPRS